MTVLAAVCTKMPEAKLAIVLLPMFSLTAGSVSPPVYVCVCVCVCVCARILMCTCIPVCFHVGTRVCVYVCSLISYLFNCDLWPNYVLG